MNILQLNPPLPVVTPAGDGYAYFLKDDGIDYHTVWLVALDDGGQLWWFENPKVRLTANVTYGRSKDDGFKPERA